jgi:hypothetical protein
MQRPPMPTPLAEEVRLFLSYTSATAGAMEGGRRSEEALSPRRDYLLVAGGKRAPCWPSLSEPKRPQVLEVM